MAGIIFRAAALALLGSLCARSNILWVVVYEWIVVINPFTIPNLSCNTLTGGARQFVVQEALEIMWWISVSYNSSLTPITTVKSSPLAGADIITFCAPASIWDWGPGDLLVSLNTPVDSITMSTPRFFQGSFPGSLSAKTWITSPSTTRFPSFTSTLPW